MTWRCCVPWNSHGNTCLPVSKRVLTVRIPTSQPVHAGPSALLGEAMLLRHVAAELRRDLRARLAAGGGEHPGREPGEARRQLLQTSTLWRLLGVRPTSP